MTTKQDFPSYLRVSIVPVKQISDILINEEGKLKLSGTNGKLLNLLMQALKFKYELSVPQDLEWGNVKENGDWTGMVGMILKNKTDLSFNMAITKDRSDVVGFSEPYILNDITFVTDFPRLLPRIYAYIYPFDNLTWIFIALSLILIPGISSLLSNSKLTYCDCLLNAYGDIMRQPTKKIFEGRIIQGIWWMSALMISFCYTAVLASFLTVPLHYPSIDNFEKLYLACERGEYRSLVTKGTSIIPLLLNSKKEHLIRLSDLIEENEWFVKAEDFLDEKYMDGHTAFLGSRYLFHFKYGRAPFSMKFIPNEPGMRLEFGIAVKKDFCCKAKLDSMIVRIKQTGLYQKIMDDEMYQSSFLTFEASDSGKSIERQINFDDISGALLVLVFGYCASLLCLIVEITHSKLIKNVVVNK